jgi:hypothetical protein
MTTLLRFRLRRAFMSRLATLSTPSAEIVSDPAVTLAAWAKEPVCRQSRTDCAAAIPMDD